MADEDDMGEVTLAVERLIDQCGKALDFFESQSVVHEPMILVMSELREAFDDLMEKMRRAV